MRALIWAALAFLVAAASPAHAQKCAADAKIISGGLRIGYGGDGVMPPERWSPLLVTIKAGEKTQSLRLTVTYDQDPTQRAVMESFVTTTPGLNITVPLLICPPQGVDRIEVNLSSEGRTLSRAAFARAPSDGEINLLQSLDAGSLLIGTLGQRVPPAVVEKWNVKSTTYGSTGLDRAAIVALREGDLTQTWAGFDGLNVVIARQSTLDLLSAPTLDALALWVTGGGRLVLIADSPGATWRRFVPPGVSVGDQRTVKTPRWLGMVLAGGAEPAKSLVARPLVIDDGADGRGWTGTCRVADVLNEAANPIIPDSGSPLIAFGPFGGGLTVVTGFDPGLASAELSDTAVLPVWMQLLDRALPDRRPGSESSGYEQYGYMISSGDGAAGAAALRSTVDSLCEVPPVPPYVYVLIVCLSAALALVVSFGDFFILGRFKARQRSWLTAAGWITACGIVAWALPNMVRGGSTTLGRACVVDVLPGANPSRPVAWRTGVTAIFSATSSDAPLVAAAPRDDVSGYWRGVSVLEVYSFYRRQTQPVVNNLPLLQRISALDGSAAAVVPPQSGIPLRQWTLRTMQDFGPVQSAPPAARLVPGSVNGVYAVTGLPAGTVFRSAAVHTAQGWSILNEVVGTSKSGTLRLTADTLVTSTATGWSGSRTKSSSGGNILEVNPGSSDIDSPSAPANGEAYLNLDGPRRRTAAFDAIAVTGQYAVVHLLVNAPPDITTPISRHSRGVYVYRIAVPLTESQPPQPPAAGDP